MPIQWNAVKELLDAAAIEARTKDDVDQALEAYNNKVIEALQLMMATALVNGGVTTPNGPIAGGLIT
jgi:hypothetical protein